VIVALNMRRFLNVKLSTRARVMKTTRYNVVNFCELTEEWQEEARRNLDEFAEENMYLEPSEDMNAKEHVLRDLSTCMSVEGERYNAVIGVSNNSALALRFSEDMTQAVVWWLY